VVMAVVVSAATNGAIPGFGAWKSALVSESVACPDLSCTASGGNCYSSDGTVSYTCTVTTQQQNRTYQACTCAENSAFVVGAACSAGSQSCGDMQICSTRSTTLPMTYNCYSQKYVGDVCSSSYDCLPPRTCTNNVCTANIALGATCTSADVCPVGAACASTTLGGATTCMNYLAKGAACTAAQSMWPNYSPCASGQLCGFVSGVCEVPTFGSYAVGAVVNASFQCASQFTNSSYSPMTGYVTTCIDYAPILAAWNTAYAGKACSDYSQLNADCGGTGITALGRCQCSSKSSGNTGTCMLPQTNPATQVTYLNIYISTAAMALAGGCESTSPPDISQRSNNDYCTVKVGIMSAFIKLQCSLVAANPSIVGVDCSGLVATLCNSAFTNGVSLLTIALAALFALFSSN